MKGTTSLLNEKSKESSSRHQRDEARRYSVSREVISSKYAAIRAQQSREAASTNLASAKVSLLDSDNSWSTTTAGSPSSDISSTWSSIKSGFHNFKAKMQTQKYIPLLQVDDSRLGFRNSSSSDSLDEIFHKLKRPSLHREDGDEDDIP